MAALICRLGDFDHVLKWPLTIDLKDVTDPLRREREIFDRELTGQVVGHAQIHFQIVDRNLGFRGKTPQLAEHAKADGGDEILQRRGTLADLFLEALVVAVNRVIFLLRQFDELFVQTKNGALLHEITARVTGTLLPLFLVNDPKLSEIDGSPESLACLLCAVQCLVNLFRRDR